MILKTLERLIGDSEVAGDIYWLGKGWAFGIAVIAAALLLGKTFYLIVW